jgi:osmotically-inducible protein OsmY
MNIKLTGLVLGTALSAFAFTACETAPSNTNTANKAANANGNVAVVVNSNTNATTANTYTVSTTNSWNANITREEYEKGKADYANRAKETGSTIGSGANDAWLWTKTRAALATTDELRESTVNVDVDNEVVTLKGTVANAAQKTRAEAVAKGIEGVKSVKNNLTVSAGDTMTNTSSNANANTKK